MVGMMSESVDYLNERLAFYKIDAAIRGELKVAWELLKPHMPRVIADFYRHVGKFPSMARLVGDHQERLSKAQAVHWQRLFNSGFDAGYLESVRAVARAHVRVGIKPDWYIGGYNVILADLTAALVKETRQRPGRLTRLINAVNGAVMFDMGIAVSVYHETLLAAGEQRRKRLAGEIDVFDHTFSDSLAALNKAAHVMRGASEQLGEATSRTTKQADSMTKTAEEMAGRAARSAAAAGSMAKSIETVENYAERAYEIAGKAAEQAKAADAGVRGLAEVTERIGSIVELIGGIARQTNLLALNATIEAARAGEAGLGFAVVAREVKTLSMQTAKATQEIADQIAAIQQATRATVSDLDGIGAVISEVVQAAEAITAAVENQAAATHSILTAVEEISQDAQGVADAVATVRAAAQDIGGIVTTVQTLASSLDEQAANMNGDVRRFFDRVAAA